MTVIDRIHTWQEAAELTVRYGLLPLTPLIPDHPSIGAAVPISEWHTGREDDPWLWRVKLAETGSAAYLKLIRGKAVFVEPGLFGVIHAALTGMQTIGERYADGLVSKDAQRVYEAIAEAGEIDARSLREAAGMRAKESKAAYDRALNELQASADIVITGVHEKRNADGEVSGWSSARYRTAGDWLAELGLKLTSGHAEAASGQLAERLQAYVSPEAYRYLARYWKLPA